MAASTPTLAKTGPTAAQLTIRPTTANVTSRRSAHRTAICKTFRPMMGSVGSTRADPSVVLTRASDRGKNDAWARWATAPFQRHVERRSQRQHLRSRSPPRCLSALPHDGDEDRPGDQEPQRNVTCLITDLEIRLSPTELQRRRRWPRESCRTQRNGTLCAPPGSAQTQTPRPAGPHSWRNGRNGAQRALSTAPGRLACRCATDWRSTTRASYAVRPLAGDRSPGILVRS